MSDEPFLGPDAALAFLRRTVTKLRWIEKQTARRDAAMKQVGLERSQVEAIVDAIRVHRQRVGLPDLAPNYLVKLPPGRLAEHLETLAVGQPAADGAKPVDRKSPAKKKPTINERMELELIRDPATAGRSARQWAEALECSKSSVHATKQWKGLQAARCLAKVEQLEEQERRRGLDDIAIDRRKQGQNLD